jgi:hypothetical protein
VIVVLAVVDLTRHPEFITTAPGKKMPICERLASVQRVIEHAGCEVVP